MGWIRAIVAVAMLVGSGTGALRPVAGTQPATPRFEPTACHFKLGTGIVAGRDVRCGVVVVPEDRSVPHGRTIRQCPVASMTERGRNSSDSNTARQARTVYFGSAVASPSRQQ